MTKTLPGSVGPAHQVFRRPGVGRAFGERPGSAVPFQSANGPCPLTSRSPARWRRADLQVRARSEQQTLEWKARYALRSGAEGTINEFAHGHGIRHCRYRGLPRTHVQHALTAIAVNIERLNDLAPAEEVPSARPLTAFQTYLDHHGTPKSKSWRTLGT
ncbi:transposase [Streptomyces sp. NBC_01231]|nr:transposase [Streptomyces sp. NBC_01231]